MDPARKRKIRLAVALSAAVLLASALVYISFTAANEAKTPGQLLTGAVAGESYQLTGKVVNHSIVHHGDSISFRVRDRGDARSIPVRYTGQVPDPFKDGREIILTVRKQGEGFLGQRDSLVTKCPSKYKAATPT